MATMVKEKARTKKKAKDKQDKPSRSDTHTKVPVVVNLCSNEGDECLISNDTFENAMEDTLPSSSSTQHETYFSETQPLQTSSIPDQLECSIDPKLLVSSSNESDNKAIALENVESMDSALIKQIQGPYSDVCHRLDLITLKDTSDNSEVSFEVLEGRLETSSYINQMNENSDINSKTVSLIADDENMIPSAPMLDEALVEELPVQAQEVLEDVTPTVRCIPIEQAMQMFAGQEMAEVKEMSDIEEAIVKAGPMSGPDHPLVDLLSTFRCSLSAREQVSRKIIHGYSAADKERIALWKVEKRTICASEKCSCGLAVSFSGKYDYAELMKSRLPAAQLRLEGLLKEVQESACHYQHDALLTYYQIEELITETLQSSKGEIREALALVLHELRVSECAPALLCGALRRWARALASALLDARDPRHLLFLMHHLFRQSRSVRWAASLVRVPVGDGADAARALALLALLLAGPELEAARECTEENEEMWEELDKHGSGGAVSEGALRERDLLALLRAFPMRALASRLLLLPRADITETRPYEWRHDARAVLRALLGARALLRVLRRAARAHPRYARLRAALAARASHALHAAAALHLHNKDAYPKEMEGQIEAELEALFAEGCEAGWPRPPCALLRPAARAAYCAALIAHLHESSSVRIEQLGLELDAEPCARTVAAVARAAADAEPPLARHVLDFLLQRALSRGAGECGACGAGARAHLPRLLRARADLHAAALHAVADLHAAEPLGPEAESLEFLALSKWRPAPDEALAVLEDWALRCPGLLPRLLLALRYTPHDGLSLETQRALGAWLSARPAPPWAWKVLTRLRVHRSSWGLPLEAPPPEDTSSLFAEAYAVLSSSWGHSVPEICEYGVGALCRVARALAPVAAHALPPVAAHALPLVMAAMACSPESVALTPQFSELTAALLAPAQSLAQWARGARDGTPELLLRRVLAQVEAHRVAAGAWLRALGGAALAGAPLAACDAVLLAAGRVHDFQEAPAPEVVRHLVQHAAHAPLACEAALRATHVQRELAPGLFARLIHALHDQRTRGLRIHVDNALKEIGSAMGSEELVIYQAATAALAAPPSHPAHLLLWCLLLRLYLHTPPAAPNSAPIGVAFFSGLIKSRTLAQLKKRLQVTMAFHRSKADTLKSQLLKTPEQPTVSGERSKSDSPVEDILTATTIADLTGESSDSSDSEETDGEDDGEVVKQEDDASDAEEQRRIDINMMNYHMMAEKMLRDYFGWLQAGEGLRAAPHLADVARFIPDAVMKTAWSEQLTRMRPPKSREDDDLRAPRPPPAPAPPPTPLALAVGHLLRIPDRSQDRLQVPVITSPVDNVDFKNQRQLFNLVDRHLDAIEKFAKEWASDVDRVATLDKKLWPLVGALRVRHPLPPVARSCPDKCQPVTLALQGCYEWRISEGVARSIKDNRSSARTAIANLCRARPREARTVASLQTIARRVHSVPAAVGVAERAWRCAGALPACAPAHHALVALVDHLAERWLCRDSAAAASLAEEWCGGDAGAERALCGALMARCGAAPSARVYACLLTAICTGATDPTHAFSYLSKFDVSRPESEAARAQMLRALAVTSARWGRASARASAPPLDALLELISVQTAALTNPATLPTVALGAARATAGGRSPPGLLAHVARAAAAHAHHLPLAQLDELLRDLAQVWWGCRTGGAGAERMPPLAPPAAALHAALLRALVGAARALSYTPARVAWCAWAALQQYWAAWVSPQGPGAPPEPRADILRAFVDAIQQIAADCPGCWEQLLGLVWEWAHARAQVGGVEQRATRADLLAALGALPWRDHQWPCAALLPTALQISNTDDEQMRQWLVETTGGAVAAAWLRGAEDAPPLAALLELLTGTLTLHDQMYEGAATLPWEGLDEAELEQALLRFLQLHHDPARPYHDAPQFRVLVAASGLRPLAAGARRKRACAVSLWARAAAAPPLRAHAAAHARALLDALADLVSAAEESDDGELEELLQRAVAPLGAQPAAAAALPVWAEWVSRAPPRAAGACLAAARALTAPDDCAPLADAAAAALLAAGGSWTEASSRLRGCAAGAGALLARGRLHAAYALALLQPPPPDDLVHDMLDFGQQPVMAAVWICWLRRCAGDAAGALLARWAEPPRLALLRALLPALLPDARAPTPRHRLLCRLALCITTPGSEPAARAYGAALADVAGAPPAAAAWARAPAARRLPQLAAHLYPGHDHYFAEELEMATDG